MPHSSSSQRWKEWAGLFARAKASLELTDDIGLVLESLLHVSPALDVLLAVPSVGLLADLLPALLVDALCISDGGPAVSQKQNCPFLCQQLSLHIKISSPFFLFYPNILDLPSGRHQVGASSQRQPQVAHNAHAVSEEAAGEELWKQILKGKA